MSHSIGLEIPQYYSFPRCREAFATGQKDARPHRIGSLYYRLRGRNKFAYTLLSFGDPEEAWDDMERLKGEGAKVRAVEFSGVPPDSVPTKPGDTEFYATGGAGQVLADRSGKMRRKLRRIIRQFDAEIVIDPPRADAFEAFDRWVEWAAGRHFMVFKGHYSRWLEMYYEQTLMGAVDGACFLIGFYVDGECVGIFGGEQCGDWSQIVITKHTEALNARAVWYEGLKRTPTELVHCGSTADDLKRDLGLHETPSWTFDLRKL